MEHCYPVGSLFAVADWWRFKPVGALTPNGLWRLRLADMRQGPRRRGDAGDVKPPTSPSGIARYANQVIMPGSQRVRPLGSGPSPL